MHGSFAAHRMTIEEACSGESHRGLRGEVHGSFATAKLTMEGGWYGSGLAWTRSTLIVDWAA